MREELISISFKREDWRLIAESLHLWKPYIDEQEQIVYPDENVEMEKKKISEKKKLRSIEIGNYIAQVLHR